MAGLIFPRVSRDFAFWAKLPETCCLGPIYWIGTAVVNPSKANLEFGGGE